MPPRRFSPFFDRTMYPWLRESSRVLEPRSGVLASPGRPQGALGGGGETHQAPKGRLGVGASAPAEPRRPAGAGHFLGPRFPGLPWVALGSPRRPQGAIRRSEITGPGATTRRHYTCPGVPLVGGLSANRRAAGARPFTLRRSRFLRLHCQARRLRRTYPPRLHAARPRRAIVAGSGTSSRRMASASPPRDTIEATHACSP